MRNFILDKDKIIINKNNNLAQPINTQSSFSDSTWFKKAQGNNSQKFLGTVGDIGINTLKGINSIGTGLKNTIGTTFINASGPLVPELLLPSQEKYQREEWKRLATNKLLDYNPVSDNISKIESKVDKYSILGNKSDSIFSGVGYYGGMIALEMAGIPWQSTAFSTTYGSSYDEAIKDGASREMATLYSLGSAAAEVASEYIFDGIKLKGTGKTTSEIIEAGTNKIKNDLTKKLIKFGTSVTGEGIEEIISGTASEIMKKITYMRDEDISIFRNIVNGVEDYKTNQMWNDFISGVLVSAITGGAQKIHNKKAKKKLIQEEVNNKENNIINNNEEKINISNNNEKIGQIQNRIQELEQLQANNNITSTQEHYLEDLKKQLNGIQNQNTETNFSLPVKSSKEILPTVQDIVNQEKTKNSSINLPIDSQANNITNSNINSNKAILPTTSDLNNSNLNIPTNNIKTDMTKIKPEIIEDIKGFKLGDPNIESYKGSYIKTMMNEVGIKAPTAMNYVSEVRPDMSFTTTKDLTRQQYASIGNALQKLKSVDVTSVNNANNAMLPVASDINRTNINMPIDMSQIKQTKGNIPINKELLNKYSTAKEIFDNEVNNFDGKVNVETNIPELNDIDISTLKSKETKELAYTIFKKYNSKSVFENDGNKITVSKSGINESVEKIFNNKEQRNLLKEHLQVFSDLGDIIEHATLVNQTREVKNRENINSWNYYFDGLNIDGEIYHLEFDVRSLHNGQNQYRVQRLQKKQTTHSGDLSNITNDLPAFGQSAFSENNIPQSNNNVNNDILPTIKYSMQNNENNTQGQYAKIYNSKYSLPTKEWNDYLKEKFPSAGTRTEMSEIKLPVREDFESTKTNKLEYIPQDPTKESTYDEPEKLAEILKEKPNTIEENDNWLKKLATIKFIDKGYYVDKLARRVKNKELSSKYDYSLLSNGIANQIIGNGRVDEKGNKIGKGLYEIFAPIENSGLLDDFSSYIYHKHNVDRMSLQNRFNEANKAIFGDGMTSEMSEKIVKEYETKYPEFESWADDIYEYNNANLEMLVKYGVLSKDSMEYYNKKYPHYVPTIREQTKTKTQMDFLLGKKASVNNPVKKAKGGNSNIIPLKDAMALRTMQTVNSALRNNFGLELLNSIEAEQIRSKENVDTIVEEVNSEELLNKSSENSSATLTVFDKGEKITFEISDEIYEALKPSDIKTFKLLNEMNNIRRGLLTEYNLTFMITNPLKDIQDGSINSKHPETFAKNIVEAGKQIKNKGQYYQLYIANGGSYETYFNYNTGTNIVPSRIDKIAPLKKISEINEVIEMTPRLAEFISSIEAGDSIETAMYNASEITTNFKRGGDITKTLDRNGVTFLNAGVQGITKQVRNVQEARVEGIKGITRLAVRWTIAGLVPTLLMNMIWGDDDDYEELSDYVKNNYYIIGKYDNGEFIRIPKGRVVSVLQSFFQNALNGVEGKKMDLKGFADLIENNLLPSDPNESSLIAPIKQAINNETWYGGDLVPTRLQNLPNAEQYDETTDSISIWLGKMLNISPYKINYVLDQYAGAIGDYTLPYLTQAAESGSDSFTGKLLAPIKDKFTVDSTLKNQNISDFYSLSEELTKKSNSSSATDEDILKNKYINSAKSEISKLYAKKREIQSSSLKDSEKYKQSKVVQKEINELSKQALSNYNNVKLYDNYAIVNDREYYKNSNEEWTKIDTTSIKYKTAKLIDKYNNYLSYDSEIKNIKKQYNNSSQRKEEVIKYINSLNLNIPQKAMLIKMNYSSYNAYDNQIINYINKQDITIDEKTEILEELGFKVRNGRVYKK